MNKPVVEKGGKMVMVTDVDHFSAIAYVHLNQMQNYPDNFKAKVPNEVHMVINKRSRL